MAGTPAPPESVTIAARPERVAVVRAFVAAMLGRQHALTDIAVLLVSELVTNSVRHSRSRLPGQTITAAVRTQGDAVRVEVTDLGGATKPALRPPGTEADGGRGLQLVDSLAARWGFEQRDGSTTTWFELLAGS